MAATPPSGAPTAAPLTARRALSVACGAPRAHINGACIDGYTDTDERNMIPAGATAGRLINTALSAIVHDTIAGVRDVRIADVQDQGVRPVRRPRGTGGCHAVRGRPAHLEGA